ncbi:MAG: hypothetical protein LBR16_05855, partial [Treponema sp.]|nr:hypothetical protein [Treponema sp.]
TLLDRRNTYLYPLQARGIKVLLGLTGGQDNVTFGSLDLEAYHQDPETLDYATEYPRFANLIKGFLDVYDLDGVEFNDADAATPGTSESVYPDKRASLYGTSKQEEREKYWKEGGEIMCNLCYELWELCEADNQDNDMEDYERRDKKYIIVRQKNFGRYLPRNVPGSPNNPVFWGSDTVIDYVSFSATVAADFTSGSFWGDSVIPSWETTPVFVRKLYGPLVVNLAGASGPVPTVAKMEEYSARYTVNESGNPQSPGDYGLVCFHNLRPVSEAASDSAFAVLDGGTDDTKQADYLSIFSRAVFDCKTVLRQGGGDYAKDW